MPTQKTELLGRIEPIKRKPPSKKQMVSDLVDLTIKDCPPIIKKYLFNKTYKFYSRQTNKALLETLREVYNATN